MSLQPQQVGRAVALLQDLACAMSSDGVRTTLAQLQQLPVSGADDGVTSELENEAAALLLQAWKVLCDAAVANVWLG